MLFTAPSIARVCVLVDAPATGKSSDSSHGTSVLITTTALLMPFIISGATDEVVDVVKAGGHTDGHVKTIVWFAVALLVADLANTFISNIGGYIGDVAAVRMRPPPPTRYF